MADFTNMVCKLHVQRRSLLKEIDHVLDMKLSPDCLTKETLDLSAFIIRLCEHIRPASSQNTLNIFKGQNATFKSFFTLKQISTFKDFM